MTSLDSSTDARRAGGRGAAILAALAPALAVAAACGGKGPSSLPDEPRLQLSTDHVTFEMFAYQPATLSPASASVRVTNPSSTPIPGYPNRVDVGFREGMVWFTDSFRVDDPGYRHDITPVNVGALDEGVYKAQLSILWPGAANSPAAVQVELIVHPSTEMWREGKRQAASNRLGHAAVALPDGGALLIGGRDLPAPYPSPAATIERLSFATGAWESAGTLLRGRYFHTATLLEDGTVLVAGGEADSGADPGGTWELYDPWYGIVDHGELLHARFSHTAVRLSDGRVLLAGGSFRREIDGVVQSDPVTLCEVFDPETRTTTRVGDLANGGASEGTAVVLPDHRVLITDLTRNGSEVGAEIFDPQTGLWRAVHPRQQLRSGHGLVGLPGGKAIAFGGFAGTGITSLLTAEIYDPETDTWAYTGSLHVPHVLVGDSAVALPSGKALVAGGLIRVGADAQSLLPTAAVETYDPRAGTWTISSALPAPLALATVTVLADGTVMAAGGYPNLENAAEFWREP